MVPVRRYCLQRKNARLAACLKRGLQYRESQHHLGLKNQKGYRIVNVERVFQWG